jgi:hypothetical protein
MHIFAITNTGERDPSIIASQAMETGGHTPGQVSHFGEVCNFEQLFPQPECEGP